MRRGKVLAICGAAQLLEPLSAGLLSKGWKVTLIEVDPVLCRTLARRTRALIVNGDPSSPGVLEDAGIRDADAVIAATLSDSTNLAVCLASSRLFGVRSTLALVNNPANREVFKALEVREFSTVLALTSMTMQMAELDEITAVGTLADGHVLLTEMRIGSGWPCRDRSMKELGLPRGCLVAAVVRNSGVTIPSGDFRLEEGDRIVVTTTPETHAPSLRALSGKD